MHDLEQLIAQWRQTMTAKVGRETLEELENHLRETTEQLVQSGMTEAAAFSQAVAELGSPPAIASEFQKLNPSTWLPIKVALGLGIATALALAVVLVARLSHLRFTRPDDFALNLLLASHVFLVVLGYTTTLLVGALGICFVGQRCVAEFSPWRVRSLARATFRLGGVAAGLSAAGIILGMVWARAAWGRYWAWDPKEIGALCVIGWQICFLWAHRLRHATLRGVIVMSVLGNIVVSLGWFGANLLAGLHSYGTRPYALLLLAAVVFHLALFLIGLAPPGWLRARKVS